MNYVSNSNDWNDRKHKQIEEEKKHDSLITFEAYLTDLRILTEENSKAMHAEIDEMINKATDYAENAAYADQESALKFVYEERGGIKYGNYDIYSSDHICFKRRNAPR